MKLIYNVEDKPKFSQLIIFSLQQLLAIITATIVVPILTNAYGAVNLEMDPAAALCGPCLCNHRPHHQSGWFRLA